jgi:hypothetical protein
LPSGEIERQGLVRHGQSADGTGPKCTGEYQAVLMTGGTGSNFHHGVLSSIIDIAAIRLNGSSADPSQARCGLAVLAPISNDRWSGRDRQLG